MIINKLKFIRVTVALFLFAIYIFIFIDFTNSLSQGVLPFFTSIQFIPAIISLFSGFNVVVFGLVLVIVITLIMGRLYCSTICPLGVFQDVVIRLSKVLKKKKRFSYTKAHHLIRYSLVFLTFIPFLFGNLIFIILLDPYSIFGRFSSGLLRYVYYQLNNGIDYIAQSLNNYSFYHLDFRTSGILAIILTIVYFTVIIGISFFRGRIYCNLICPVGTLLGLISKFSLYKFSLNKELCNGCGSCESVCKSECIDSTNRKIDMQRCVTCFNCLSSCPSQGVELKTIFQKTVRKPDKTLSELKPVNLERRNVVSVLAASLTGLMSIQACTNYDKNTTKQTGFRPIEKQPPISPPGSVSNLRFTELCTACHLCVTHCPSQVLKPSIAEYGWTGIMQPKMDYHTSFCNYECVICSEICPTKAILPITKDEKKTIQLGKVRFIRRNCVVRSEGTECGACSEHCPTKAVYMVPFRGNLYIPEVNPDICVGCGACEYACPTVPFKAIYVETNIVHQKAKLPEKSKIKNEGDLKNDFPF